MKLTLPMPPSTNKLWATVRGHRVSTAEARRYKSNVALRALAAGVKPIAGPVVLTLAVYRGRKSGDLSNRIKCLEDSLTGIAYADDSQVVEIRARRYEDPVNPRVEVTVEPDLRGIP